MKQVNLEDIPFAQFADAAQSTFRIDAGGGVSVALILMEMDSRPTGSRTGLEQFSLLFRGPVEHPLPQRLYAVEHDVIGRFDLFIVPVGRDESGYQYEAIFNRAIRTEGPAA